ncbi:MAG: hypothetical protein EZS28_022215 [Streblomastix strix]|uniref:Uncharacterized protein n=1 Tax=Streblomastix strix TaxID=222440 RepID=A0A5J4VI45_9EUKA|nr:MAG: hypothetical protein EZS28_022215 [Streblomastix strix]
MSKNSIKPEPSEPGLFMNFDSPKFITKTPVTTINELQEKGDEIGNFLQSELQLMLQDIERQLTPKQAVSERTKMLIAKVQQAMISVYANEIDFWAKNILVEQNGQYRRREIQCPSLLPITSVQVPDEVLDAKRSPIDKILQSEQALALYNFRIGEGLLAHLIAHAGSAGNRQKRHSEQGRDMINKFTVWNLAVWKSKGQNEKISLANTIGNLETGDETNAELE